MKSGSHWGGAAVFAAVAAVAGMGSPALAGEAGVLPDQVQIVWRIDESAGRIQQARVSQEQPVTFASASARNVLRVKAPVPALSSGDLIPAGTELARAHASGQVYCETQRRVSMSSLRCLADADGDGTFDHAAKTGETQYGTSSKSDTGFTIGRFPIRKWKEIAEPLAITSLDSAMRSEPIELRLMGYAYTGGGVYLNVCVRRNEGKSILGFRNEADYCMGRERKKTSELPGVVDVGGLRVMVSDFDPEAKEMTVVFVAYPEGMRF